MKKISSLVILLVISTLSLGCASSDQKMRRMNQEKEALEGQIKQTIGGASCRVQSQCRVLPLGAKPCGGASHFWAYSTENTDELQLQKLAARHSQISAEQNRAMGRVSNCQLATPPLLYCREGRCVTEAR